MNSTSTNLVHLLIRKQKPVFFPINTENFYNLPAKMIASDQLNFCEIALIACAIISNDGKLCCDSWKYEKKDVINWISFFLWYFFLSMLV